MASNIDFQVETDHEELIFVLSDPLNTRGIRLAIHDGDEIAEARLDFHELHMLVEVLKAAASHLTQVKMGEKPCM